VAAVSVREIRDWLMARKGKCPVSGPLDRRSITSAMVFVAIGFVVGASGLGWVAVSLESTVAERVTELALVFLPFSDSARLDLGSLRREVGWPSHLLLIGLPLTSVLGLGAGLLLFPGMAVARAFLLSTMLCSTDAALGQRVVEDPAVPARARQALDVESGLNDGLAVPFFRVALDIFRGDPGGWGSVGCHQRGRRAGWLGSRLGSRCRCHRWGRVPCVGWARLVAGPVASGVHLRSGAGRLRDGAHPRRKWLHPRRKRNRSRCPWSTPTRV
jgi:Sodium/hydrogen exchanger family